MIIGIPIGKNMSGDKYSINTAYVNYVVSAGLTPQLILPLFETQQDVHKVIDSIDGLLLPGGIDLDPVYYGYDNRQSFYVDPKKDEFERTLFHAALEHGTPVFGICRGLQLIAYELLRAQPELGSHMSFCQHISEHSQPKDLEVDRNIPSHFVQYLPELYQQEAGKKDPACLRTAVNSMHHQCLLFMMNHDNKKKMVTAIANFRMLAWTTRGLREVAKSVVCEAFAVDWKGSKSKVLAVQWHPEELMDTKLLNAFFEEM